MALLLVAIQSLRPLPRLSPPRSSLHLLLVLGIWLGSNLHILLVLVLAFSISVFLVVAPEFLHTY